jgi:hypothetical protein
MDWMEYIAERRIEQAQREGVFDDLPGKGLPLPRDKFADLPQEIRLAARVLANSGYAPEEVTLLKALNEARARVRTARSADEKSRMMRLYVDAELRYSLAMERYRRSLKGSAL